MPPSTDPVQSNTNQYRLILTQFLQVPTSSALYWPSGTKNQPVFERISTCRSFLNLTSYWFTSGVEFDQGYLSFLSKRMSLSWSPNRFFTSLVGRHGRQMRWMLIGFRFSTNLLIFFKNSLATIVFWILCWVAPPKHIYRRGDKWSVVQSQGKDLHRYLSQVSCCAPHCCKCQSMLCIPHICNFFYTGKFFGE